MFFVTLLLNAVLGWMRGAVGHDQPARAALHGRDLRLLPAGRRAALEEAAADAAQAGARVRRWACVLATQNPVDLDYKGLSNAGTWLIGRLQTERDKQRVLDGLEGASGQGGLDRAAAREADLGARQPRLPAEQRARGRARGVPDALDDVVPARAADAAADRRADGAAQGRACRHRRPRRPRPPPAPAGPATAAAAAPARRSGAGLARPPRRPPSPSGVSPAYLPLRGAAPAGASLAYVPMLIGGARVRLLDTKNAGRRDDREHAPGRVRRRPRADRLVGRRGSSRSRSRISSRRRARARAFHELPARRARGQGLRALVEGLRRLALPDADGDALAQPVAEARLALGRVRGRLPRAARAGRARGPRLEGRRAAREVRRQGRRAAAEAAHGRSRPSTARRTRSAAPACRPPSRSRARSSAASSGASRSRPARSRRSRAAPGASPSSTTTSSAPRRTSRASRPS